MNRLLSIRNKNKITLYYLAAASLWILVSNALLNLLIRDLSLLNTFRIYNTWLFGLATAVVVYLLAQRETVQASDPGMLKITAAEGDDSRNETDEKRFAEEIREKLVRILRRGPAPMAMVTGENHVFDFVNDAYFKMMGYKKLEGLAISQVFPEAEKQGITKKLDKVYKTGKPYLGRGEPVQIYTRGELKTLYRDVLYNPITDDNGRVIGVCIQLNDITKQVEAKRQLSEVKNGNKATVERLHNQIKNDYSLILTLFEMQSREMEQGDSELVMEVAKARVNTLSSIRELDLEEGLSEEIPFHEFIHEHIKWIYDFYEISKPDLLILTDDLHLQLDRAVPLALVLNEICGCLAIRHSESFTRLKVHTESPEKDGLGLVFRINSSDTGLVEELRTPVNGLTTDLMYFLLNHLNAELMTSIGGEGIKIMVTVDKKEEITELGEIPDKTEVKSSSQPEMVL